MATAVYAHVHRGPLYQCASAARFSEDPGRVRRQHAAWKGERKSKA